MALNKKNRLKRKKDFEGVFKKGKAVKGSFLFIKYRKNDLDMPRLGFIVSAKIARKAVERNKIRRTLSEAVRKAIGDLGGYDIIVFVTRKTSLLEKKDVITELLGLLKKIQ